ncbi:hypothetical protein AMJ39_09715 [candidate division TA06 bacterium DG_24]|uniref:SH3b domain-containing protein n=3 Tax=Bacteria division TA06 TaxID=1156500 RepID=A0A0S8J996_UNCT6|nr:MAG: hypothetical protein AMJ39_09715 [candidate division TA06 bacterium DG_24]KPK68461.1 MAG: hypothetical protein AMJ82_08185 [candidate division TA06 bacterium SM23_40]KPL06321.1 MAG: hypothetical protein AMJ71_10035 [candidate division TA06 bacterium SM1_40]
MEVRICVKPAADIMTGPGPNHRVDEGSPLIEGEKIYVLEKRGSWVRFRLTPRDDGWSGWVKKEMTVPESAHELAKLHSKVERFQDLGFIRRMDLGTGNFYVEPQLWAAAEPQVKMNIVTTLSEYSELSGKSPLVEVKDADSGQTLAKAGRLGIKVYL